MANKQNLIKLLDNDGWHLSNEYIDDLFNEKTNLTLQDLKTHALNVNFSIKLI